MYVNQFFRARSTVKCFFTFFSDQKCVRNFPWRPFHLRCFIFNPCATHFNEATYSKTFTTVKRFTKRVDEFFKYLLKPCFQKTWFKTYFSPFFHLMVRHPWWGSSIGIFRFGIKLHHWCFRVLKFQDQLFYRISSDGCLWWRNHMFNA